MDHRGINNCNVQRNFLTMQIWIMWTLYAIALFLLQVLSGSLGNVLLGKWNETVLACSSNTELTFKFKSSQSTKYIAIAQCDLGLKSCQLMDTVLRNKYNISYTGRGGLLYIISQNNDTNGTYTCSETYNSDIFASTNVTSFNVADTTKPASVECSSKAEITFSYSRRNTNTSRSLAECDHTLSSCTLFETDAQNKYTISYTGRGGILRVNNLEDETIGTYTCCETYSTNNCISTDVFGYYTDELRNSSDGVYYVDYNTTATSSRGYNTDNQTNTLTIVLPICAVLLVVLIVICVVIYLVKKRNRRRKGPDLKDLRLSVENMNSEPPITLHPDADVSQLTEVYASLKHGMSYGTDANPVATHEGAPELSTKTPIEMLRSQLMNDKKSSADMIANASNCYVSKMTDLDRLNRFIFFGTVPQQFEQLQEIHAILKRLFAASRGLEVVQLMHTISVNRRNVRQDALIYAYAFCCRLSNDEVKRMAYLQLSKICRIPTELFMFIKYCEDISRPAGTGWGRAHRRAVSSWYTQFENNPMGLLRLLTKYKRWGGFSNTDVIRLAHVKSADPVIQCILRYIVKGYIAAQELFSGATTQNMADIHKLIFALEDAKIADNPDTLCNLITTHRLTWEQCPTWLLKSRPVLTCLLQQMPIEATVRKLGLMTGRKVFDEADGEEMLRLVVKKLDSINNESEDLVEGVNGGTRKVLHPLKLYKARNQYMKDRAHDQEQMERRSTLWSPIQMIGDALERAFNRSFSSVQPTGKRIYFVHSVSDLKITFGNCELSLNEISAVMSVTLARTEENCKIAAIGGNKLEILDVDRNENITLTLTRLNSMNMPGEVDWSLPIKDAIEREWRDIDVFLFYIDCKNAYTTTHVFEAMIKYRQYCNNPAVKLIVCGLNALPHSLADNDDVHMLNISGFNSSVPKLIEVFVRGEMQVVTPDAS